MPITASFGSLSLKGFRKNNSSFFNFNSFTFTNAGAEGRFGPTLAQCQGSYAGTAWVNNSNYFSMVTQGYQIFTIPTSGSYTITAAGAAGGTTVNGGDSGSYVESSGGRRYGFGRVIRAVFNLVQGNKIIMIVGQRGGSVTSHSGGSWDVGGGGGGASAVFLNNVTSDAYLMVAGGGNGTNWENWAVQ